MIQLKVKSAESSFTLNTTLIQYQLKYFERLARLSLFSDVWGMVDGSSKSSSLYTQQSACTSELQSQPRIRFIVNILAGFRHFVPNMERLVILSSYKRLNTLCPHNNKNIKTNLQIL